MKVAVLFGLVATCFAATYSVPAIQIGSGSSVGSIILDIENATQTAILQTKTIANEDNEQLGKIISEKLDVLLAEALAAIDEAYRAAEHESWTDHMSTEFAKKISVILVKIQTDPQQEFAQLSNEAAGRIRDVSFSLYASVEGKFQELLALSRQ